MTFSVQPVTVATGSDDREGCLLFAEDQLVAVLVCLSGQHSGVAGRWYLEAGFGRLDGPEHPVFPDIESAQAWAQARLASRRRATLS